MPQSRTKLPVTVSAVEEADLLELAEGQYLAFGERLYGETEPVANRAPDEVRYRRAARRMLPLIRRTDTLVTKATVPGPDGGKPIVTGMAFWHLPGAAVDNLQKRKPADKETDEEREAWEQVDWEKWNGMLEKYDVVRRQVMGEEPHWYLGPLWTHPDYQGQGVGGALLRYAISLAEASGAPMYLEASPAGQPVYARYGWERVEGTETVMIRTSPVKPVD